MNIRNLPFITLALTLINNMDTVGMIGRFPRVDSVANFKVPLNKDPYYRDRDKLMSRLTQEHYFFLN